MGASLHYSAGIYVRSEINATISKNIRKALLGKSKGPPHPAACTCRASPGAKNEAENFSQSHKVTPASTKDKNGNIIGIAI